MKNHLKRVASPKTWAINRKEKIFTVRPKPGAHSLENGLPLGVLIRDFLHLAETMSETKKILNNKIVNVDGRRRKSHRFIVGLFDVVSLPEIKKHFRMLLDAKGRLFPSEIDEKESTFKICKVVGKSVLRGGRIQYRLHDGKNVVPEQAAKAGDARTVAAKVGDSFVIGLPDLQIKRILPLKKGARVFLTGGKHVRDLGILEEIKGSEAVYTLDGTEVATTKNYIFVVGEKEAEIELEWKGVS
ncbi:MAG: 30S ribosomal protein S4e [Nanoarchaeota archaeon]